MSYDFPRVKPQLAVSGGTGPLGGARDCAFVAAGGAIEAASHGALDPTVDEMRARLGDPLGSDGRPGGISMAQARTLIRSYGIGARLTHDPVDVTNSLIAGHMVELAIDYGYIKLHAPELSGQLTFTGDHAVLLKGYDTINAKHWTGDGDGLHDNRRAEVPKGPLPARIHVLLDAAAARAGGLDAVVVRYNAVPPADCSAVQAQLDAATARLAAKDGAFTVIISTAQGGITA